MRMGNSPLVTGEDSLDGNHTGSLLVHPRIWLGGISQTSIMARIENLQRKKSSKTTESFDTSISNGTNEAGTDKSRTNSSTTNEAETNETIT